MKQLLVVLFLMTSLSSLCQSGFRFRSISVDEGLNQSTVNAIAEDSYGFLWFGTQEGLARYDGHQFKVFRSGPGATELSNDFITCLSTSGENGLWVGTASGLNFVATDGQRVDQLNTVKNGFDWTKAPISQIASLGEEALVIASGSTHWVHKNDEGLTPIRTWTESTVQSICTTNDRFLIADSTNWLWEWQLDGQISKVKLLPFAPNGMKCAGDTLFYWKDHLLEVMVNGQSKSYVTDASITDASLDQGRFWIATTKGLEFIHDEHIKVKVSDAKSQPLSSEMIMSVTTLKNGSIAFGTQRYGAFVWSPMTLAFQHLPGNLFADPIVWSAELTGNELFVGSAGGLDLFEVQEDFLYLNSLYPEKGIKKTAQWTGFHACALLREGDLLWVGTTEGFVLLFDKQDGIWVKKEQFQFGKAKKFYSLTSDPMGRLTIASNLGLYIGTPGQQIDSIFIDEKFSDKAISRYSHHATWQKNKLWVSSTTGLYTFDKELTSFEHYKSDRAIGDLPSKSVASTLFTSEQVLYVATLGSGFAVRSAEADLFTTFGLSEGLINDYVYGFVEGKKGVWGSCNEGNFLVNGNSIRAFASFPQVPFLEHSQNAFGNFDNVPWFGGIDGFYLINERQIPTKRSPKSILITEVLVNYAPLRADSKSTITGNAFSIDQIDLVEANNLSLQLSNPGIDNEKTFVSYRLDNHEWLQLNSLAQRINFASLSDGNHLLEIGLSSNTVDEVDALLKIPINVHPPFWKSTWFLLILLLGSIAIVIFILNTRNKRILKEERLKRESFERVKNERERISMDLHDNIGAQITHVITSLDNLSYRLTRDKSHNAQDSVEGLSDFARGTMQQLRDTIWTMNKEHIQMNDFVIRVQDYLGRILADRPKPRFSITNTSVTNKTISPELAIQLFRIIQEATTNALKHADAEQISIEFQSNDETISFTFVDDGKGFSHVEESGDHYGVRNMKSRIENVSGNFDLRSTSGEGTVLTISVPLK